MQKRFREDISDIAEQPANDEKLNKAKTLAENLVEVESLVDAMVDDLFEENDEEDGKSALFKHQGMETLDGHIFE